MYFNFCYILTMGPEDKETIVWWCISLYSSVENLQTTMEQIKSGVEIKDLNLNQAVTV